MSPQAPVDIYQLSALQLVPDRAGALRFVSRVHIFQFIYDLTRT